MHALVASAGDPPDRAELDRAWPGWADGISLVIAADGGALTALGLGFIPDLIVGDVDSLAAEALERIRAMGVAIRPSPMAKDESDTELAIRAAVERGARDITIVGGQGGRPDHFLANIGLLALPELAGRSVRLLDGMTRISLLAGPARKELEGRVGDLVSLLPFGRGVDGVSTTGLAWVLEDEPLPAGPARGLSNVRTERTARVSVRQGLLGVVETTSAEETDSLSS